MTDTPLDLESFRVRLLSLRDELLATRTAGKAAAATVELDQTRVGRLSRMDAMQAQAISVNAQQRRDLQLRGIERALAQLDADNFGFCVDCDETIAQRRLEFDPTATRCIRCASQREP